MARALNELRALGCRLLRKMLGDVRPRETRRAAFSAGFTLIELLVVAAIIVVITTITLASNSRFGGTIQLDNLAYDLSLSIRQAQVYGISVARFGSNTYNAGYGMHFLMSDPTEYEFFGDAVNANGLYDTGELVQTNVLQTGFRIAALCATLSGQAENCSLTQLDILFKRPDPDAWISANGVSCINAPVSCQESSRIVLQSPRGDQMNVIVDVNGQISVRRTP